VSTTYEVGPFRLDSGAGVLTRAGLPLPLGGRAVAVLAALVKQPNEFVPKEIILDAAWPGVVVEEANLAVQISAIRRVLAEAPGGEHWIETLARRGYRFVGPVTEVRYGLSEGSNDERRKSNLPEPLSSFVGRERELVEIKRLLPRTRLLTLVGMGGIGKTRLGLQVAAEVSAAYPHGTWLVDLASLVDPALVPSSVAQVLGTRDVAGTPLIETLCRQVQGQQMLLLLDNCEHLLEACAELAGAMLRAAAELTIIATSREPLHVAGEQTFLLTGLSLPDPLANVDAVAHSEAVQLFVERARQQQPDFALTQARAAAVAELCIHLDGIPLALELAAARVPILSVEQINSRLQDRFKLLTGGSHAVLPRQQTLRATLDWSFDLLTAHEQVVFPRLGIFVSGFTLEAASAVASDVAIDEFAVIDLLSQLVARSLVVADTNDAGARYRLLETTRAYALEKLADAGETEAIKRRHAQYFRDFFERASEDWERLPDADWCATYPPELDNVRAALDWAFDPGGDPTIGIGLSAASGPLWYVLALRREGPQRLEAAIARVGSKTPEADQASLWHRLGELWCTEAPTQAVTAFERAIDLYRRVGDVGLVHADLLATLGGELARMGRVEQAAVVLAEAFAVLERAGAPKALAHCFLTFGNVHMMTGDLTAARIHYERGLALGRSAGAETLVLGGLMYLADIAWQTGDLDTALAGFRETAALMRARPLIPKGALGMCLTNLAGIHTERMELDEALEAACEGLPLRKEAGFFWCALDHVALRAALTGKLANAARLCGYADSAFAARHSSRQPNEARARTRLQTLLRENFVPDQLDRLFAEGAKMSEDEAGALALQR